MSGPARAGLLVYTKDSEDLTVLQSPDSQLLLLRLPAPIAAGITIQSPLQRREATALKLHFPIPSLSEAREAAARPGAMCSAKTGLVRDL